MYYLRHRNEDGAVSMLYIFDIHRICDDPDDIYMFADDDLYTRDKKHICIQCRGQADRPYRIEIFHKWEMAHRAALSFSRPC